MILAFSPNQIYGLIGFYLKVDTVCAATAVSAVNYFFVTSLELAILIEICRNFSGR